MGTRGVLKMMVGSGEGARKIEMMDTAAKVHALPLPSYLRQPGD